MADIFTDCQDKFDNDKYQFFDLLDLSINLDETENNPKYANRIIKRLKTYAKANHFDKKYVPYKAAYGSMPTHAKSNPAIQRMYINGHFCYAYKLKLQK